MVQRDLARSLVYHCGSPRNEGSYKPEKESGYLKIVAPAGKASTELEDWVSQRPGHPDHLLSEKGFCEAHAYQRLHTAGWVLCADAARHDSVVPLLRCQRAIPLRVQHGRLRKNRHQGAVAGLCIKPIAAPLHILCLRQVRSVIDPLPFGFINQRGRE